MAMNENETIPPGCNYIGRLEISFKEAGRAVYSQAGYSHSHLEKCKF